MNHRISLWRVRNVVTPSRHHFLIPTLSLAILILPLKTTFAQTYFQQEVNYKITVSLNDVSHELSAFEEIEYINNSPEALEFIYFHLWPNAYDNNQTALGKEMKSKKVTDLFEDEELRGYIDSLDFKVDGEKIDWEFDSIHIDICRLNLNSPLKPGEKITITSPFHVKIPKGVTSRLGHVEQSYQITQWYPKPAVYDNRGWHAMPYRNMGEFYSEYGSFDVSISLPQNYIVGATGDLQNPEEISWLNELAEKTTEKTDFDKNDDFPESSGNYKTLRYIQQNVHDFAWFADKRFNVLKGERQMPHLGDTVTCWAMFLNREAELWKRSVEYISDALYYYSLWYGDYPYRHCTAVHSSLSAGGGMEYPNITVIGNSSTDLSLEMVIMHEVGHNWFYGILGFNEREFPMLDEGINSFSEARYIRTKYKGKDHFSDMITNEKVAKILGLYDYEYKYYHQFAYLMSARMNLDQPSSLASEEFSEINYGIIVYFKTSRIFDHLLGYLGEEEFNRIMQKFYQQWKYKHPYPEDLRIVFEQESGKDLSWLFDDLLHTSKKLDYKIVSGRKGMVTVKNTGQIPAPFPISGLNGNEEVFSQWHEGFSGRKKLELPQSNGFDKLVIDQHMYMPEMSQQNNYLKATGVFRKMEPLRLKIAGFMEYPQKTNLYMLPALGWNYYNKTMAGLIFYNSFIPRKQLEYRFMPLYSFGSKDIAGSFTVKYHFLPYNSFIRELNVGLSGMQYAYQSSKGDNFQKLRPEISMVFKNVDMTSKIRNTIRMDMSHSTSLHDILSEVNTGFSDFYTLEFTHNNRRAYYPYSAKLTSRLNKDFIKVYTELTYSLTLTPEKNINFRLFAGSFLKKSDNMLPSVYDFVLSGQSSISDYLYDDIYFGRFEQEGFLSQQYMPMQGGFYSTAPNSTNEWLVSLNAVADLPLLPKQLGLKVFGNAASFERMRVSPLSATPEDFAWEIGFQYTLFRNFISFSLPVLGSEEFKTYSDVRDEKWQEKIRFTIDLNKLNLFELPGRLL